MAESNIYNEDCLGRMKSMEEGSVDSIVTDLPFEMEGDVTVYDKSKYPTYWDWFDDWSNECNRILKGGGFIILMNHPQSIEKMKEILRKRFTFYGEDQDVVAFMKEPKKEYEHQSPYSLFHRIISKETREGDTIFDPFMGVGTLRVISQKLGRNYIGCEIDRERFNKNVDHG